MRERLGELGEFLQSPPAQAVILVTIACVAALVAWYILSAWRDRNSRDDTASDHLTNFRDLHRRGVLSDGEFRTIKTVLGEQVRGKMDPDDEES